MNDETETSSQPASPLENVVDDLAAREQTAEWIFLELSKGRTCEEVTAELIGDGWEEETAPDLVEEVRRLTRQQRGVVTRDAVVRDANHRYRRAMGSNWFAGMPSIAAAFRLIYSLVSLAAFKRVKKDSDQD